MSFFGLFRKSHLLPPSPREFSPATFFTRSDFTFRDSTLLITVRWSKTIQFGQRNVTIPLVALPSSIFCPVSAVSHAFSLTSGSPPSNQAGGIRTTLHIGFSPTVTLWLVSKRTCRGLVSLLDSMGPTLSDVGCHFCLGSWCSSRFHCSNG